MKSEKDSYPVVRGCRKEKKNGSIRAVVFDFDGTLARLTIDFDEIKKKIGSLGYVFMGKRPEPNNTPALEWIDELAEKISPKDQALEFHSRCRLVIQATELDAALKAELFDYTVKIMQNLRDAKIKTGVITRNSAAAVKIVCPGIEQICDVFISREDARQLKPDPGHLHQAMEFLGVSPNDTLMVGDHHMDIETGKRAGTMTAGVASGNMKSNLLMDRNPDFVAENCEELIEDLFAQGYLKAER